MGWILATVPHTAGGTHDCAGNCAIYDSDHKYNNCNK